MSEEVTSGEIQRYMERQDKLMSEVISEQKMLGKIYLLLKKSLNKCWNKPLKQTAVLID